MTFETQIYCFLGWQVWGFVYWDAFLPQMFICDVILIWRGHLSFRSSSATPFEPRKSIFDPFRPQKAIYDVIWAWKVDLWHLLNLEQLKVMTFRNKKCTFDVIWTSGIHSTTLLTKRWCNQSLYDHFVRVNSVGICILRFFFTLNGHFWRSFDLKRSFNTSFKPQKLSRKLLISSFEP